MISVRVCHGSMYSHTSHWYIPLVFHYLQSIKIVDELFINLCRGTLVLDCRDFNNSGVEQCFTYGSSQPEPCKPPASGQAYPKLTQALASGQAIDGHEGSLCVLANTGNPLPAGARSPFIPASAGGGACNLGLNCLNLGVSAQPF